MKTIKLFGGIFDGKTLELSGFGDLDTIQLPVPNPNVVISDSPSQLEFTTVTYRRVRLLVPPVGSAEGPAFFGELYTCVPADTFAFLKPRVTAKDCLPVTDVRTVNVYTWDSDVPVRTELV